MHNDKQPQKGKGMLSRFMANMRKMHGMEDNAAEQSMHHTPLTDDEGLEADGDSSKANTISGNLALEDTGEKAQDFKGTMKKLFHYLGAYKFKLIAVIIFAVLSTAFAVVGPRILGYIATEILNGMTGKASGGAGINSRAIVKMATWLLALYPISALFSIAMGTVMTGISQGLTYKLRKEVSEKIGRIPMKYFETRTYGEVLSRVTNDIDTMSQSLNQCITQVITSATMLIGIIAMMLSISPIMTLVAFAILPVSMFVMTTVVKKSQKYFQEQQEYLARVNGQVEEVYAGHNIVRAYNKEADTVQTFEQMNNVLYNSAKKSQFLSGMVVPVMSLLSNIVLVAEAILGGYFVIQKTIVVGDIQAFLQYVRFFTDPIHQVAQVVNLLQSTSAASERVFNFLDEQEEEQFAKNPVALKGLKGNVDFDHVRFGYNEDKIIIRDFNAKVNEGQKIAIVGHTGAGKTTMVKLLMRFYDVNSGAIMIGGHDIQDFNRGELRQVFGMVLQDTWLFNGSIRENIRYGKLEATDDEIITAAKAANVHHFVQTLPDGYDMVLNEEASNVSQGQKQLLTIARAILADPKILILDEATSSVDTRTEILIQKAMDNLMKGRTSFIIAHRLSTIRNADLILVMEDGDIVEQGNHDELLDRNGLYANLYRSQFEKTSA